MAFSVRFLVLSALLAFAAAVITHEDLHKAYNMAAYCVEPQHTLGTRQVRYDLQSESHCINGKAANGDHIQCKDCQWNVEESFATHDALRQIVHEIENKMEHNNMGLWLVKMAPGASVTSESRKSWESAVGGHVFGHYVYSRDGNQYHTVYAPKSAVGNIRALGAVDDVIAVPADMKLSPELSLLLEDAEENRMEQSPALTVLLAALSDASMARAVSLASKWQAGLGIAGMTITAHSDDTLSVKGIPVASFVRVVEYLAAQPECIWMEPIQKFVPLNNYAKGVTQSNNINTLSIHNQGIRGEGIVVGVGDSGLDYMSNYFYDPNVAVTVATGGTFESTTHRKISQYVAYADNHAGEASDHGSHVQGTIAGDTISTGAGLSAYNGNAYKAKLAFFDIGVAGEPYLDVPASLYADFFPKAYSRGARLHSNSWGASSNTYNVNARDVDRYQWEHQDFLVLVAAGNSGDSGSSTIGTPATSKNGVCVGATQNNVASESDGNCAESATALPCEESMAYFSSRGPMFDGRWAPTVSAPGFYITSVNSQANPTQPHDGLTKMAGTSMATPTTTGNTALIQQYYQEGWYPSGSKTPSDGFSPMGALLKATLMNSADYMKGTVSGSTLALEPSNAQGFGRIHLDKALAFSTSTHSLAVFGDFNNMKQLNTGTVHTYHFQVTATTRSFKVTLAYSDYPAATNAASSLINDVDLLVTTPAAASVYPNSYLQKDATNNIEQIEIKAAATDSTPALTTGTYTVTVTGARVTNGPQPYALVVSGIFDKTAELYPGHVPSVTAGSPVVQTTTVSLGITGTGFSAVTASNTVTLSCGTATVTAATISSLTTTVDLTACASGPLLATVTNNGFASSPTQVANVGGGSSDPCDGVICTSTDQCLDDGECEEEGGSAVCVYPSKDDGTECDDGNAQTDNDECVNGVCGGYVQCDGTSPCLASDQCHNAGECTDSYCTNPTKPNKTPCNDGVSSTVFDKCDDGVCRGTMATPGPPIGDLAWIMVYVNKTIALATADDQANFLTNLAALIGFDPAYLLIVAIDYSPVDYNIVTIQIQDDETSGVSAVEAMGLFANANGLSALGVYTITALDGGGSDTGFNTAAIVAAILIPVFVVGGGMLAYYGNKMRKENSQAVGGGKAVSSPYSSNPAPSPSSNYNGNLASSPSSSEPVQMQSRPKPPSRPPPRGGLPPGWQEMRSDAGEIYFWHAETERSTWDRPTA